LFIAGKRIKLEELEKLLGAEKEEILEALRRIKEKYRDPIVVEFDENSAVMRVADRYLNKLWKLGKGELSQAELKTLGIVAYYAPVKQSYVVKVRGNRAYEHIRKLEEFGFIRTQKRGNTKVIYLTQRFFDYFGEEVAKWIRNKKMGSIKRVRKSKSGKNLEI